VTVQAGSSPTAGASKPAISAFHLHRFYHAADDETLALRDVSLDVWPGDTLAIVGPSGSGKSSLLNCLAGSDTPDGGTVSLFGNRLSRRPEKVQAVMRAQHIGVLRQSGNLFPHLTLRQNLRLVQSLSAKAPVVSRQAGRERPAADDLLGALGMIDRADAYPRQLSGGEAVRGGLAMALANDPAVLIADEPTGELDSESEDAVLSLLADQAADGVAVLIASHSARVIERADRVIRLVDGRVVSA
jgi:putative ABC transport system ATP-binding protein